MEREAGMGAETQELCTPMASITCLALFFVVVF